MGDYFNHWIQTGKKADASKLPGIFYVNWFRKDENGKFIWPGYGDNIRVLEWIFNRLDGADNAVKTPKGYLPKPGAINTEGLDISPERMNSLFDLNKETGIAEMEDIRKYYDKFNGTVPKELYDMLDTIEEMYEKL
ncbi:MAG: hypothetical protein B6D45_01475 [Ignavibacteriales bacterium UTCHB3]|nr:MAG: hypothetical protein B6D45_01475 [Ignavibacteriales bacterium UTCHB3]